MYHLAFFSFLLLPCVADDDVRDYVSTWAAFGSGKSCPCNGFVISISFKRREKRIGEKEERCICNYWNKQLTSA